MNSRFSQSACTAIPTFTAFVIPPALAIFSVSGAASVDMNMIMNLWVFGVRLSEI